jgi:hypothetical protein
LFLDVTFCTFFIARSIMTNQFRPNKKPKPPANLYNRIKWLISTLLNCHLFSYIKSSMQCLYCGCLYFVCSLKTSGFVVKYNLYSWCVNSNMKNYLYFANHVSSIYWYLAISKSCLLCHSIKQTCKLNFKLKIHIHSS